MNRKPVAVSSRHYEPPWLSDRGNGSLSRPGARKVLIGRSGGRAKRPGWKLSPPLTLDSVISENTRLAYESDLKQFVRAGGKIPCKAADVIDHLEKVGEWLSVATMTRRFMAIRYAHAARGLPSPTSDPAVKQALRAFRRKRGVAQRQAKPLTRQLLRQIVRSMGRSPIDRRDKALLLLGFAGGFRRSELVALDVEDLESSEQGLSITIRRSKTDQESAGRKVAIPAVGGNLCPLRAIKHWLIVGKTKSGPLFRSFNRHGGLTSKRLDAGYVSEVVKYRLNAIGVDPKPYSAHSLRAGLVTEAARAGVPSWKIRQQTGHRSEATLALYIRDADLWHNNSAAAAFGVRIAPSRK